MPKIIEIPRHNYDSKQSHQKIALAVGLSKGAIAKYVSIAAVVGVNSWPLPDVIDEQALERRFFPNTGKPPSHYIEPDKFMVHQELKRKNVTLLRLWAEHEERVGEHANRYTQFSQRY